MIGTFVHLFQVLESSYKWYRWCLFSVWLTRFSVIISLSIHDAANGTNFTLLSGWVIVYWVYVTSFCIHLVMDSSIISMSWVLQWLLRGMCLSEGWFYLGICSIVRFLISGYLYFSESVSLFFFGSPDLVWSSPDPSMTLQMAQISFHNFFPNLRVPLFFIFIRNFATFLHSGCCKSTFPPTVYGGSLFYLPSGAFFLCGSCDDWCQGLSPHYDWQFSTH